MLLQAHADPGQVLLVFTQDPRHTREHLIQGIREEPVGNPNCAVRAFDVATDGQSVLLAELIDEPEGSFHHEAHGRRIHHEVLERIRAQVCTENQFLTHANVPPFNRDMSLHRRTPRLLPSAFRDTQRDGYACAHAAAVAVTTGALKDRPESQRTQWNMIAQ